MDDTGFEKMPTRYDCDGKEAIDIIREELGDDRFYGFCIGTARKYELRAGKKGPAENDLEKAHWYREMAAHVAGLAPDPRAGRKA